MSKYMNTLTAGDLFTTPSSRGTVMRCERVGKPMGGRITVVYSIPGDDYVTPTTPWSFSTAALATFNLV